MNHTFSSTRTATAREVAPETSRTVQGGSRPFRARRFFGVALAVLVTAGIAGCAAAPGLQTAVQAGSTATDEGSSTNRTELGDDSPYSLTQIVQNTSDETLTLQGVPVVDNQATMQAGYPTSIAPKTSGTYRATNSGNGVQMWLHFTTAGGATVSVDSDGHQHDTNTFSDTISGPGLSFGKSSNSSIGSGHNPTAQVYLESCSKDCNTSVETSGFIVG